MQKEKQLVPQLRFPEFEGKWEKKKLIKTGVKIIDGDRGKNYPNGNDFISGGYCLFLNAKNVTKNGFKFNETSFITEEKDKLLRKGKLKRNDILLTTRGSVGHIAYYDKSIPYNNIRINSGMVIIRGNPDLIYNVYLYKYFNSIQLQRNIAKVSFGSAQPQLTVKEINRFSISFPNIKEQQKIASFLTQVDSQLTQLTKKKTLLEQYKKGVMQKIFKQELRFKDEGGKAFPEWEERKFADVLFEHKLKSTGKEEVHSVSVHKGVINQIEHLGRSFSAKDTSHYSRALHNDIIYTKSPTGDFPLGIIKQNHTKEDVIISPLYGVFTPETKELGYILHVYFESAINTSNYLSSIIQKGAKNTINITNTIFLSKKMLLPVSKKEQTKIANFLSAIDKNIALVNTKIEQTKTYKKGLLQQMFV